MSSPLLTCHSTISASCKPSPRSGSLKTFMASRRLQSLPDRGNDALRAWHILILESVKWHHHIVSGDALHRREQRVQPVLGDVGCNLRTNPSGERALVHDHTASGFLHRREHGTPVER